MTGTQPVRDLLDAELRALDARRQAIFAALRALDQACDHAVVEPTGGGFARCTECQELTSLVIDCKYAKALNWMADSHVSLAEQASFAQFFEDSDWDDPQAAWVDWMNYQAKDYQAKKEIARKSRKG